MRMRQKLAVVVSEVFDSVQLIAECFDWTGGPIFLEICPRWGPEQG